MRKLLIATVLLLIFIGSFYAALPAIAEYSVRQILTDHQISASFDLKRPDLNRIEISKLTLKKETAAESFILTAESISINFNPWQLFNAQRIKTLDVETLKFDLVLDSTVNTEAAAQDKDLSQLPFPPLPSYLFSQIPADSITLSDISINIVATGKTPDRSITFSGSVTANQEQLAVNIGQIKNAPQTQLQLIINDQDSGKLTVSIDQATVIQSDFKLAVEDNRLNAQNQSTLFLEQLKPLLQQPLLTQFAELPGTTSLPNISGTVTIQGSSLIPLNDKLSFASHQYQITSKAMVQELITEIGQLKMQQDSKLTLNKDKLILSIQQLSAIAENLNTGGTQPISSDSIQIVLQQPLELTSSLDQLSQSGLNNIVLPDTALLVRLQPVTIKAQGQADTLIKTPPVNLKLSALNLDENSVNAKLTVKNIEVNSDTLQLPLISLNNSAIITPDKITNRFTIHLQDPLLSNGLEIIGSSKTDPNANRSTAYWKTSLPLTGIEKLALRYVPQLPPELVVTAGTLQHQGWLDQNSAGIALRFLNRAENISLSYDQTHLYDINGDSETVKSHRGKLSDTGQLKITFIDAGVPLENFSGSYRFEQSSTGQQKLQIYSSNVDLLGGRITTLPITIDPKYPDFNTAIAVTGIDLKQLMALEQQEGLTGSGTLNGQIPISFKQGQLTIVDGQINSTPEGGWIKFDPPATFMAMTQTTPALGIAFDAMRNMKYQSLGIKLDYQPAGDALLKAHLKGHNPNWNDSQPVDLTINIEENVPKLLQALQFTDKLTKTLEKRYR